MLDGRTGSAEKILCLVSNGREMEMGRKTEESVRYCSSQIKVLNETPMPTTITNAVYSICCRDRQVSCWLHLKRRKRCQSPKSRDLRKERMIQNATTRRSRRSRIRVPCFSLLSLVMSLLLSTPWMADGFCPIHSMSLEMRSLSLGGSDGKSMEVKEDADRATSSYSSKSTAIPDDASEFYEGSQQRRERLHQALEKIGVSTDFLESPQFQGSAALRTYNSFMLPKSKGALAMANQPQRAAVVANNISFLLREHRSHQQDWLRNHDRSLQEAEEAKHTATSHPQIVLILDDVRSAHNVGNILRAAEASRCKQVILCGSMTPSPPHPKVLKTALGAAEYVRYQTGISTLQAVQNLKADGYRILGIETTSRSKPLWQASFFPEHGEKVAVIFGNELVGVDIPVLEQCDELVSVPTHGVKNSLNVATCASIIIWEALRQWEYREKET
eukprot:scaffold449_cov138-Cylindrotheca_fusiformis.AAC.12